MADQKINVTLSMKELFEFIPKIAKEFMSISPKAAELSKEMAGTEFTFLLTVDGTKYGLVVKNGTEFIVNEGNIPKPMVAMAMSIADIEKMVDMKNADMLLGQQDELNKGKYDTIKNINGKMTVELTHDDGAASKVSITFNGATSPEATLKMKMSDFRALIKKENNPVSLFMSGGIKLEGDMGLAMALQPLMA
jgi:putative sterol carrier protein